MTETEKNWEGAVDTDEGRAHHRTTGSRAWCDGEWCYLSSWCTWCYKTLGYSQVWLPRTGTPELKELVEQLAPLLVPHQYPAWGLLNVKTQGECRDKIHTVLNKLREGAE